MTEEERQKLECEVAFWNDRKEEIASTYDAIINSEYNTTAERITAFKKAIDEAYTIAFKMMLDAEFVLLNDFDN